MAIVRELSGNGGGPVGSGIEKHYGSPNRAVAAVVGTTAPSYVGEVVTDTTADQNYIGQRADKTSSAALTSSDWVRCA
jgi:hypothetical protein